ncbi:MAG: sulfotransferase family 2 domain-containing protein [Phaeodactylibacter sp.]|nr:sulfotransferase family 2 domain-containing protein [Phaeodactylibacter sp.]
MKPFICFVHIEKAGGITLHNLLHRCFPGYISPNPEIKFGEFFSQRDLKRLQRVLPYRLQGIGGHRMAAFNDYESVLDRPVFYFTFMRDPVKRYMSHINWQTTIMGMEWDMETFNKDPEKLDYHAYRIAGERNLEKASQLIREKFNFVGLLERYDESLLIMRQRMGLPDLDIRYEQANIMGKSHRKFSYSEQSDAVKAQIQQNNAIDLELYRITKEELWPKYLEEYDGDLEADLRAFRASNEGFQFPRLPYIKRKGTNFLMKRVIQPIISR